MASTTSVFKLRRDREKIFLPDTEARTEKFLSENSKTDISLNFPIINCKPTSVCSSNCYACTGQVNFKNSVKKALSLEKAIKDRPIETANSLIKEITKKSIENLRYAGTGDLTKEGANFLVTCANKSPNIIFWGFTRKLEIVDILDSSGCKNIKVIFSMDASTPKTIRQKVLKLSKYKDLQLSWLYSDTKETKSIPSRTRVVFPVHIHGKVSTNLPKISKECPAVRSHDTGCSDCKKCFNF